MAFLNRKHRFIVRIATHMLFPPEQIYLTSWQVAADWAISFNPENPKIL